MSVLAVVALVGRLIIIFALMMAVPLGFALYGHDPARDAFVIGMVLGVAAGLTMSLTTRRFRRELQPREGFLLVGMVWFLMPVFAAIPLRLGIPGISVTDAFFEAMSGFTATGATVLSGIDDLPLSINVWRCFLQLIGGLGIIVLAVAILPLLGVGGAQLFKTEMTGPMKDTRFTPRIAETARGLWTVYSVGCVLCFFAYRWAGMSWVDAFMHMCSTMSLGGFSSHDASFGYWDSPLIEVVAVFFMLVAGISFVLYFLAWQRRTLRVIWRNAEARAFLAVMFCTTLLVSIYVRVEGSYDSYATALRHSLFHVVSVGTTTGYASRDYGQWPVFAALLILLVGCFASCAGSTGGGIKMMRMLLLLKQSQRELVRILHPSVVNPVVVGGTMIDSRIMANVIAFMMLYGAVVVTLTMVLLFSGLDTVTAFTAVIACVNNIGPGLGGVGPASNFGGLTDFQIWVLSFGMLLGRVELLSVLVLFTPRFWRR